MRIQILEDCTFDYISILDSKFPAHCGYMNYTLKKGIYHIKSGYFYDIKGYMLGNIFLSETNLKKLKFITTQDKIKRLLK